MPDDRHMANEDQNNQDQPVAEFLRAWREERAAEAALLKAVLARDGHMHQPIERVGE